MFGTNGNAGIAVTDPTKQAEVFSVFNVGISFLKLISDLSSVGIAEKRRIGMEEICGFVHWTS